MNKSELIEALDDAAGEPVNDWQSYISAVRAIDLARQLDEPTPDIDMINKTLCDEMIFAGYTPHVARRDAPFVTKVLSRHGYLRQPTPEAGTLPVQGVDELIAAAKHVMNFYMAIIGNVAGKQTRDALLQLEKAITALEHKPTTD